MQLREVCAILLCACAAKGHAQAQLSGCGQIQPLAQKVVQFHASRVNVPEALLRLGSESGICIAVEFSGQEFWRRDIDIHGYDETSGNLVKRILASVEGYDVSQQDGFVTVRPHEEHSTWLDYKLRSFKAPRTDRQQVSNLLHMSLALEADRTIKGFVGNYRPGDPTELVGPFDQKDRTVRQLLNLIVASSRGGMWIARSSPLQDGLPPKDPFWTIFEYSQPIDHHFSNLRAIADRFKE